MRSDGLVFSFSSLVLGLVYFYFFSIVFQYIGAYIYDIRVSEWFYWRFPEEAFYRSGFIKYCKDILMLALLMLTSVGVFLRRTVGHNFLLLFLLVSFYVLVALIGNVLNGYEYFIIAGLRWYFGALFCFMFCFFFLGLSDDEKLSFFVKVEFLFKFLLLFSFLSAFAQYFKSGFSGLGSQRYYGIYANSGVFGFATVSFMVFLNMRFKSGIEGVFWGFLCFLCALLSGSRMAMLSVFVVFVCFIYGRIIYRLNSRQLALLSFTLIMPVLFLSDYLLSTVDTIAGRGSLLAVQYESGRMLIMAKYLDAFFSEGFLTVLFGYGLGFGTNAAVLLSLENADILDSTLLVLFLQAGIIGFLTALIFMFLVIFRCKTNFVFAGGRDGATLFAFIVVLTLSMLSQNVFENYMFMISFLVSFLAFVHGEPDK